MAVVSKNAGDRPRMGRIFVACRGKKGASSPSRAITLPLDVCVADKPTATTRTAATQEDSFNNDSSSASCTPTPTIATTNTPPDATITAKESATLVASTRVQSLNLASAATTASSNGPTTATATNTISASASALTIEAGQLPESARSSELSTAASGPIQFPTLLADHRRPAGTDLGQKAGSGKKGSSGNGNGKGEVTFQIDETDGFVARPALEAKAKKSKAGKNCSTRNCCQADIVMAFASSLLWAPSAASSSKQAASSEAEAESSSDPSELSESSSDGPTNSNSAATTTTTMVSRELNLRADESAKDENAEEADAPPAATVALEALPPPMSTVQEGDPTLGLYSMGSDVPLYTMLEEDFSEDVEKLLQLVQPGGKLAKLSPFAKEYATPDFALRILRKNGRGSRAAQKFEQALVWRQQEEELISRRQFPLGGDERVMGLDKSGRPVIYMCMKNQILCGNKCLKQKVVTMLQAVECMPPGVEKTVHIWDLHGQQFFAADLSPAPLIKMMHSQDTYFAERLQEIVIIGMPRAAAALKDLVWPLVSERTKGKLRFLRDEQEAQSYIETICDPELAARLTSAMRENRDRSLTLEQRKQTWRRYTPEGRLVPLASEA